jgi:N6-L-threonylcarbamoyladenine synthase
MTDKKLIYILGIETSCDETAASVILVSKNKAVKVLSNVVSSQIEIHEKYYGVVPEIAAREHVLNIIPVVNEALAKAKIKPADLKAIAVTSGPGLVTSLLTGVETAKTLAYTWKKPLIAVNHIAGHIYANFAESEQKIKFPALVLTVSGGHTNLVLMSDHLKFQIIGETLDDAAGEAYDKAAKMMGLGYPGGPIIDKYAAEYRALGNKKSDLNFPRPMLAGQNLNFSFSGLKTSLLYQLKKDKNWSKRIPEYCYEYQQAILDVLIGKTIKAAKKYNVENIMLAGGVAMSRELRAQMEARIKKDLPKVIFSMPNLAYTTDNAVMIATAGYYQYLKKDFTPWFEIKSNCNLNLS